TAGRYMFAEDCKSLAEAVRKLEAGIGPAELGQLDESIQAVVNKQFRALVHVCMAASSNVLKRLAPAMQSEAQEFLRSRLGQTNITEIYCRQFQQQPNADECL